MPMDVHRLRVFRSVVAAGSVRGAAEALGFSPASVSQQVAQLQRETGLELVRRVGRGIEPTPAGLELAARLDGFFAEFADLEGYIAGLRAGRSSTVTLCYFSSLGTAWIPELLATLTREFPDLRIDLHVRDDYQPTAKPRPDLQLVAHRDPIDPPSGYDAVTITADPYLVAVPAGHRLAGAQGSVALAELRDEKWIDINAGQGSCREIVLDACAAAGFRPDLHIQAQDYATTLALVAAGVGIAALPALGAVNAPDGVRLHSLHDPQPRRIITALVARDIRRHPVAQRTLDLLHAAAGAQPGAAAPTPA